MTSPARLTFLASPLGIGALALHAVAGGEPHFTLIGTLLAGWGAVATTGVVFPSLEMYGPILFRGPAGHRRVALTFDDGPHPVTTRQVLAALAPTHHRGTFFVLGEKVRSHPEVVREILSAGHTVASHGYRHDRLLSLRMPRSIAAEIVRAADAVEAATGTRPRLFRPPLGHISLQTVRGARRAGVTLIGWSSRGYDGMRRRTPEAVVDRVARTLDDGAIVMLHDAAEHDDFEPACVRALPQLLALLDARELTSVGVETLIGQQSRADAHCARPTALGPPAVA